MRNATESGDSGRRRFHAAIARAVDEIGGDRAAEQASGISKSIWYDAKTGRTLPNGATTWPAMRTLLTRLPAHRTGVRDWDRLYAAACAESGRSPFPEAREARTPVPRERPAETPRQLPPGTIGFLCRDQELAWLGTALLPVGRTPAVAVVTGAPGVGKTALAVAWARQREGEFPDGVLYTDLRGWGTGPPLAAEEVLPGWLRALGMNPENMRDVDTGSAMLRTGLAGQRVLLVLDNARSEEQVRPLLPGSAPCAVLVTSRHAMPGLAVHHGARSRVLKPLSLDESVRLLSEIGGARVSRAQETAARLAELCGRLPLALRVVAESIRGRSEATVELLAGELSDEEERLDLMDGDDPRSDPRTVFSWSYQQLPEAPALSFRLLGLFPGFDFDAHAVAALTDTTPRQAARTLRALERANLVHRTAPGRYGMHDLLRLYAAELARRPETAGESTAARTRLLHYYLDSAHRADELVVPQRYRLPRRPVASAPAPMRDHEEALAWLDAECGTAVALCGEEGPGLADLRWRLAFLLRGYFFLTKRLHAWVESHEAALRAAIEAGDLLGEAMTRSNLGVAFHERGQDEEALAQYEIAERLFTEVGDPHGMSNTLAHQAAIRRRRGEPERALDLGVRALSFYQEVGSRRNAAITLRGIALARIELGHHADAERDLIESMEICADLALHMDAARARNSLGRLLVSTGRHAEAADVYRAALADGARCGSRFEEALALHGLGAVAAAAGDGDGAATRWRESLELLEAMGSPKAAMVRADLAGLSGDQQTLR